MSAESSVPGDRQDDLYAVGAGSFDDVWAVGERLAASTYDSGSRLVPYPLIEHWNGNAWTVVAADNPNRLPGALYSITVISPTDAWAVGGFQSAVTTLRNAPLVEHWNGIRWSLVAVPAVANAGPHHPQALVAVAGVRANDVWALGNASSVRGAAFVNRLLHWNGQTWTRVPGSAVFTTEATLSTQVSATVFAGLAVDPATGSPWAVGGQLRGSGESSRFDGALLQSWTGEGWADQKVPKGRLPLTTIAFARSEIWALRRPVLGTAPDGERIGGAGPSSVLRWKGRHWDITLSSHGTLSGLGVVTNRDVWIAGAKHGSLLMHWDGNSWTTVATPAPITLRNGLFAMTVAPDKTVLALGVSGSKPGSHVAMWAQCHPPSGST